MSTLPASLFVKEPGKTRTLILGNENLKKEVRDLKMSDILEVEKEKEKIFLLNSHRDPIGEIVERNLVIKLSYALDHQTEVQAVFVNLSKITSDNKFQALFILKSSLPIFANEKASDLKPFLRGPQNTETEKADEEKTPGTNPAEEETMTEEANPLAGLKIVEDEKPSHGEEES